MRLKDSVITACCSVDSRPINAIIGRYPRLVCLPSVYLRSLHVTKSPFPFISPYHSEIFNESEFNRFVPQLNVWATELIPQLKSTQERAARARHVYMQLRKIGNQSKFTTSTKNSNMYCIAACRHRQWLLST